MNKIDRLIEKLCPNGVEYMTLGDIGRVAMCKRIMKSETNTEDGVPFYKIGTFGGVANAYISEILFERYKELYSYPKKGDILISAAGTIGRTVVFDGKPAYFQDSNIVWLEHDESKVLNKYLYYFYETKPWKISTGGTIARIYNDDICRVRLPVPPLEVQREIIHILDSFTSLTSELTSELTARKKQYEFYRDELLKPKANVPLVTLNDIATDIYRGSGIKRDQVTTEGIPCVRYGEIYTTYNTWFDECVSHTQLEYVPSPKYFEYGDILFAITGESVEDIAKSVAYIGHEKCLAGGDIVVLKHKQNPRYLAHVLATQQVREQKSKGKVKSKVVHSNVSSIGQITIPLPPLDVQKRYADVLDNFEKICTDLNIGLPAEIEARQKQYEYYRDLLLTFAESGSMLETDRQTELNAIRLIQYVFGYAVLPLRKVANVFRGEYITRKSTTKGDIPVILGGQEPAYYINKYNHDGEIVVIARSGVSAGFVSYWNRKIYVTDGFGYEGRSELVTTKYLYYVLKRMEPALNAMKRGAGVPHVSGEILSNVMLLIPALQEQNRIVNILHRFDTFCNDLTEGLPAEIKARQKQYEYYRDKLLSFEELQKK